MKITNSQPKPTSRQTDILLLLFRFRFLNRSQIQQLLRHKDYKNTIKWLSQLTEYKYVSRYYDPKLAQVPAVYSLGSESRKYLAQKVEYPELLDRIRREPHYSEAFRNDCLFLANLYLALTAFAEQEGVILRFWTKVDLFAVNHLTESAPDAYFSLKDTKKKKQYFLEFLSSSVKIAKKQVDKYTDYYDSQQWQEHEKGDFPKVVLLCQDSLLRRLTMYVASLEDGPDCFVLVKDSLLDELLPKKKVS